ncbi:ATP-binding cassette domain-containing protein, partial [Gordonia sp. NPDC003424]
MSSAIETKPDADSAGGKVPLIELKDVGKSYGAIIALKGINLRVNAGEVTCVLGDNGAGKSTLIKIMAGLHQQTEGQLLIDGEEIKLDSPKHAL